VCERASKALPCDRLEQVLEDADFLRQIAVAVE
jgi:hypothetical protein